MRPRTLLVTGSVGTLGTPLTAGLRQAGYDVHGCDLKHSADPRVTRCDIADYRQLERLCRELKLGPEDMVYHLAAEFGRHNGEDFYEQLWRTNVIGTKNLIRLQEEFGFKVIFASSSEAYGDLPEDVPYVEETTETHPLVHHNDYAVTKWVNEGQFRRSIEQYGTETMILRFFNAYGPGEHYTSYRSVVCLFAYRALHNMPYTVYEGYHRVFMYVDDMMSTLVRCVERFRPGTTYNVGGTEYRSVREMSDLVLRAAGRDDSLVTYRPKDEMNVTNKRPIVDKAVADLDHDPRTILEEGVPKTIAWMRDLYNPPA